MCLLDVYLYESRGSKEVVWTFATNQDVITATGFILPLKVIIILGNTFETWIFRTLEDRQRSAWGENEWQRGESWTERDFQRPAAGPPKPYSEPYSSVHAWEKTTLNCQTLPPERTDGEIFRAHRELWIVCPHTRQSRKLVKNSEGFSHGARAKVALD